jgi:hypothetical protein
MSFAGQPEAAQSLPVIRANQSTARRFEEYTMDMSEMHTTVRLNAYGAVPLEDARGRVVTCVAGIAWLTMEGDGRDIVLRPRESFTIDRDGLTLIAASQPGAVSVSRPRAVQRFWHRVRDAIAKVYGPAAIRSERSGCY